MKPLSDEFTAFIGIDWADKKHDICLQGAHGERREFARIEHKVDAIDQWAISMRQRFGAPIAVALELTKGPLVYALQKYDFFVLFPINPATLAKYREAFKPSRAKDDPTDAEHALELLMHHRERLTALNPQSVPMRTLLHQVEQRRRVVDDKTRFTNRLGYALKQYLSAPTAHRLSHLDRPAGEICQTLSDKSSGAASSESVSPPSFARSPGLR